jgi:hypothetical protein
MMDFSTINLLSRYAKEYGHAEICEAGITDTEHKTVWGQTFAIGIPAALSQFLMSGALIICTLPSPTEKTRL